MANEGFGGVSACSKEEPSLGEGDMLRVLSLARLGDHPHGRQMQLELVSLPVPKPSARS